MEYKVLQIDHKSKLCDCPVFKVDRFNWGGDYRPVTYGQLAFKHGHGFYLTMTCEEPDPGHIYEAPNSEVYLDSTMEAFFCFQPEETKPLYMNFEINSFGAMLAATGRGRTERDFIPDSLRTLISCSASIFQDHWSVSLFLPLKVIYAFYGQIAIGRGKVFTCNFYKIKESPENKHFSSYAPIVTTAPNFHLPEFFADARIQ